MASKITKFFTKSPPSVPGVGSSSSSQQVINTQNPPDQQSVQQTIQASVNTEPADEPLNHDIMTPGQHKKRGYPYSPGEAATPHTSNDQDSKKQRELSPINIDHHVVNTETNVQDTSLTADINNDHNDQSVRNITSPGTENIKEIAELQQVMREVTSSQKNVLVNNILDALRPKVEEEIEKVLSQISHRLDDIEKRMHHIEENETTTNNNKVTVLEDKFAGFDFGMDGIKHSIKDGLQLTNDLQRHVTDLEDELDDLQQYTRRDQIIIDNMPEKADEITDQIVLEQCKKLNVDLSLEDIHRSHRLGPQRNPGNPRPIIAQLSCYKLKAAVMQGSKDEWMQRRQVLRNSRARGERASLGTPSVYVREHLTWRRQQLMKELLQRKKAGHILSVWTVDGAIFVRKAPGARPARIVREEQMRSFLGT